MEEVGVDREELQEEEGEVGFEAGILATEKAQLGHLRSMSVSTAAQVRRAVTEVHHEDRVLQRLEEIEREVLDHVRSEVRAVRSRRERALLH